MNVQPWAMYTPQTYPFALPPGIIAPGTGSGQWPSQGLQGLIGNVINGLAGLGQAIGGLYGQPQFYGQPQYGQISGGLQGQPQLYGQPQFSGQLHGQPQFYGQPQLYGQPPGGLGGFLPFYAVPLPVPGAWGGQLAQMGGQWTPQGLMGGLFGGLAGPVGQPLGGIPPFQAAHGM